MLISPNGKSQHHDKSLLTTYPLSCAAAGGLLKNVRKYNSPFGGLFSSKQNLLASVHNASEALKVILKKENYYYINMPDFGDDNLAEIMLSGYFLSEFAAIHPSTWPSEYKFLDQLLLLETNPFHPSDPDFLIEAWLTIAAKLCKTDGPISTTEVDGCKKIFKLKGAGSSKTREIFNTSARDLSFPTTHVQLLNRFSRFHVNVRIQTLVQLTMLAKFDSPLKPQEQAFLERVGKMFGMPPSIYNEIIRDAELLDA